MKASSPLKYNIMVIDCHEEQYRHIRQALKEVSPDMETCYIPSCHYDYLGAGSYTPDLIFLCIDLEDAQGERYGLACLRKIRNSGYREVPVIAYSSQVNANSVEAAYESGASLFVGLPERYEDQSALLKKVMKLDWTEPQEITHSSFKGGPHGLFPAVPEGTGNR